MLLRDMTKEELLKEKETVFQQYEEFKALGLRLNMARGKPGEDQLDISTGIVDIYTASDAMKGEDGMDFRNYGVLDGTAECKKLMADMLGTSADNIIVYGNSSLNIMYETLSRSMTH